MFTLLLLPLQLARRQPVVREMADADMEPLQSDS